MNTISNSGKNLIGLSSSVAILISENLSTEDIALLGAFFTTVGDNLSLIAAASPDTSNTITTTNSNTENAPKEL